MSQMAVMGLLQACIPFLLLAYGLTGSLSVRSAGLLLASTVLFTTLTARIPVFLKVRRAAQLPKPCGSWHMLCGATQSP